MNNYDFRARRTPKGLLISGHVGGPRPGGRPFLEVVEGVEAGEEDPTVRVYRLRFRKDEQLDTGGLDFLEMVPSPMWKTLRILLPKSQEFVIHSRRK